MRAVVIGTGALGSAAAYHLARRLGDGVLILEQFAPGHTRGASEDHSRIIRHSYHSRTYTRLTRAMFAEWEALEAETGMRLVTRTGGLDIGWPEVPDAMLELEANTAAMRAEGIDYELLDAQETMRRWPQWRLPEDAQAIYQPDGGILDVRQACAAHLALAIGHGAQLRTGARVEALEPIDGGVLVRTAAGAVAAEQVVVCAAKWTNRLLGDLGPLPLRYTREQVHYFATPRLREFAPERFPIWIRLGEPSMYGFPVYGTAATKAAQDLGGPLAEVDDEESPIDPARIVPVQEFLARHLPGALGPVALSRSCLYDLTPDRNFVLDALPSAPRILVTVGAGHAAKFGALIGRLLSEMALDGRASLPVEDFSLRREAMAMPPSAAAEAGSPDLPLDPDGTVARDRPERLELADVRVHGEG